MDRGFCTKGLPAAFDGPAGGPGVYARRQCPRRLSDPGLPHVGPRGSLAPLLLSAGRSSLLMRSCFSGRKFFFMDFLSFGDPSRRCSRSSSRRWGCGDSCRRWHSADSTGLRRGPEYQLPRRLRRAADFGGGALGGRRTRPVLLSIGAKSSSARGGAVAAHILVP